MKLLKQHWRGLIRVVALLLLCAGIFFGYGWFYRLAPVRRTLDPEWCASHSPRAYWREVQKGIQNGFWSHDDGFTVGQYGDKSWAEWIMARIKPGFRMGCIGEGPTHSASSMRYLTNQNIGENADDWLAWWRDNSSKTQEEWIAEGFRTQGYEITIPPAKEQIPILLRVLGRTKTNEEDSLPEEMKYNAFRCLRDSGFDPVVFAIQNQSFTEEIKGGLLEYSRMERLWPVGNGIGILSFGSQVDSWSRRGIATPRIMTTRFQVTANALVFGMPSLGVALLFLSLRNSKTNFQYNNNSPPINSVRVDNE